MFPFTQKEFGLSKALYLYSYQCQIEMDDQVVITLYHKAKVFNDNGWVKNFPEMNEKRWGHGCGFYINDNKEVVSCFILIYIHFRKQHLGISCYWRIQIFKFNWNLFRGANWLDYIACLRKSSLYDENHGKCITR